MPVASQNNVSNFLEKELDKLPASDQQKSAMKAAAKAITQPASPESSKISQEIFYKITKSTSLYVEDLDENHTNAKNILLADLQLNGLIDDLNAKQAGLKPKILDQVSRNKNPLLFAFADCLIGFVGQIPEQQDADSFHKIFSIFADLANGEQDLASCAAKLEELKQSLDTKDTKTQDAENAQQTEGSNTEENPDSEDPSETEKRKKQQERENYILFASTNLLDLIKSLLMSGKTIEEEELETEKKKKEEENEILNGKLNGQEDKNKSALGALLKFLTGMLLGKGGGKLQTNEQSSGGGGSGSEEGKSQEAEKNSSKSEEAKAENQATVEAAKAELTSNQASNQLSDQQATLGSAQEAESAKSLQQSFEGVKAVFEGIINTIEAQMQAMQNELQNTKTAFQTLDNATLASQAVLANESQAVANQNPQQQTASQTTSAEQINSDSQSVSAANSQSLTVGKENPVINVDLPSFSSGSQDQNSTENFSAIGGIKSMLNQVVDMLNGNFNQAPTISMGNSFYTPDPTSTETKSASTDTTKSTDAEKTSSTETKSSDTNTKSIDTNTKDARSDSKPVDARSDSKPVDARSASTEKTTREAFSSGLENSATKFTERATDRSTRGKDSQNSI